MRKCFWRGRRYSGSIAAALALSSIVVCGSAMGAQAMRPDGTYPSKPVRIIVPFPPGGSNDIIGRYMAMRLSSRLGRQFVVDNRGGADSVIGTTLTANAPADGYTMMIASITYTMVAATGKKLPYDPLKSLSPVASIGNGPNLFAVWPGVPATTMKDLIALAKAKPGQLRYASSSTGGNHHFAAELLKLMAGINITQIPYKGGGPAMLDVMAGNVEIAVATLISAIPHVRSNRLRALAVSSLNRSPIVPDVPTVSEAGVTGYEGSIWWGLLVPAGTPAGVVERLHAEVVTILKEPETVKWLESQAAEPLIGTPEAFGKLIASNLEKWTKVARESGIDKMVRE